MLAFINSMQLKLLLVNPFFLSILWIPQSLLLLHYFMFYEIQIPLIKR